MCQDLIVPEGFSCVDEGNGHFAYPYDCNVFMYCNLTVGEEVWFGRCPEGFHFRPHDTISGLGSCMYIPDAGCVETLPEECNVGDAWDRRVPQTCNRFTRCRNGVTQVLECSGDLHWDSKTEMCTTPNLSDCPYPICSENFPEDKVENLPHPTDCTR